MLRRILAGDVTDKQISYWSPNYPALHRLVPQTTSSTPRVGDFCRNAKELHCVGLHWRVPFIEVLSETV